MPYKPPDYEKQRRLTEHGAILKPGDTVMVRLDDGEIVEKTVKYAPWQLGHGEWVIGLNGIAGGYALDRVLKVVTGSIVLDQ